MAKTVADIGRLVGCSSATVSRAINNSGPVSAETRAAVLKALRETRYLPRRDGRKAQAASKATERGLVEVVFHRHTPTEPVTMGEGGLTVGPLLEFPEKAFSKPFQISNSFYRQIVDGAVEELSRWGHNAVLKLNSDLTDARLIEEINQPDRRGILLMGQDTADIDWFITQCRHPLVLVDYIHNSWPDAVTTDNFEGITAAFDHLYQLGHRKFGFAGMLDEVHAFSERFTAFKLCMVEAGLSINPQWVDEGANHVQNTADRISRILALPDRPTAFICANDCSALGVVRAASGMGVSIPNDLSVVGFDDQEAASLVTPALTTVHVPMAEIGRQAVRQLMIQLRAKGAPPRTRGCRVRLLPDLVVRESTAAPKA